MSKQDKPPIYTNRNGPDSELPHYSSYRNDQQMYFEGSSPKSWEIVILNRYFVDGFRIFVSLDAAEKFEVFKKNKAPEVIELQTAGIGVPIFKAITPLIPLTTKFLTFRRYVPTNLHPFDIEKDYYNFCTVKKKLHVGYDSFLFDFVPDPNQPKLNFQIIMFAHSTLPINDYIYNGEKHRWIDESIMRGFRERFFVKYGFKHTILGKDQTSLCDSWDGQSEKLDKSMTNPYLKNYLKTKFSLTSRFIKPEYYGVQITGILGEMEAFFLDTGYAELKLDDIYNTSPYVDYESINSLNIDALVHICIATCLKRRKDIIEDSRKRSNGGGG
ncbi:unnamed protein product [Candida verbasci]|uniref:Uncharacterized protein n=1 Tax=Candida verbasci TaxID=1227364 RepID=A0A9W4XMK5_9ASCO|nr:unnamed protein product [Candida verbasci]